MGTIRVVGYIGSIVTMAVWLSACATAKPPETAPAPPAQSASRSAEHIYVTGNTLDTACYRKVGEVSFVEPFSVAVTDPGNLGIADELRKTAEKKYPNRVDAIISVHTEDHDIGSEVLVSGEAVQLEPPSKLDCKLPDEIAAALASFATGTKPHGARSGVTTGSGFNGPAGTSDTADDAQESPGDDPQRNIKESIRHAMLAVIPGQTQVDESTLADRVQLQEAEIKRLRKDIGRMVGQRCEAQDISAAQCAAMRKNAELVQPREVVPVVNNAGDSTLSAFEIQNFIQAQQELIAKLRRQAADMNETLDRAASPKPSN